MRKKQNKISISSQPSLGTIKDFVICTLQANLDIDNIHTLEADLLNFLDAKRHIVGVIIDFSLVAVADDWDLRRLQDCLLSIRVMGRKVALCGIKPGLAGMIVRTGQELYRDYIGRDIDDLLMKF